MLPISAPGTPIVGYERKPHDVKLVLGGDASADAVENVYIAEFPVTLWKVLINFRYRRACRR
jgi:hypothetical protein